MNDRLTSLVERRDAIYADLKRLDERHAGRRHLGWFARRRWDKLTAEYEALSDRIFDWSTE